MLNRRLGILALGLGLVVSVSYAQRKPAPKPAKPGAGPVKKVTIPEEAVTLGSGESGGTVKRDQYLRTMSQPLRTNGQIESFSFTYAERNMYEDSAGNPLPVTDYLTQTCYGDTLVPVIRNSLRTRCKPGDTAYYDEIRIRRPDGSTAHGKSMKFTIIY